IHVRRAPRRRARPMRHWRKFSSHFLKSSFRWPRQPAARFQNLNAERLAGNVEILHDSGRQRRRFAPKSASVFALRSLSRLEKLASFGKINVCPVPFLRWTTTSHSTHARLTPYAFLVKA
ncbi:MAG: hypothetical protein ACREFD_18815, partial [Stellaceae bacterium]